MVGSAVLLCSWCTLKIKTYPGALLLCQSPSISKNPSYILKNVVVLKNFILIKEGEKYSLSFAEKPSIQTCLQESEKGDRCGKENSENEWNLTLLHK